jgi:hypothetical protein
MGSEGSVAAEVRSTTAGEWWIIVGSALLFLGVGVGVWYASGSKLRTCEEAIAKTLKAPSTYRRVNADGAMGSYNIEYDAENSFGVPLRGKGLCTVDDSGAATWLELTN